MSDDKKLYDLTRRKVLGSLGALGVGAALGGAGTAAFFSDEETFEDNRLVAGSLDLKVDWEEHYSDWSADEAQYAEMAEDPLEADFLLPALNFDDNFIGEPDGNIGLTPSEAKPIALNFVEGASKDDFWNATAIEAYPDTNNDGIQDIPSEWDICNEDADIPNALNDGRRTNATIGGDPNPQSTSPGDPLIEIQDVKPGDFGEVTFSFHLCDNPGYIWMTGDLVSASENGLTEPESKDPDEDGPEGDTVELLDKVLTRVWRDDGNNQVDRIKGDLDVVCAIDTSGSVSEEVQDLEDGVNAFIDALDATDSNVQVGTLEFGGGAVSNQNELQDPGPLSITITGAEGNTPMPGALDIADQALYNDPNARSGAEKLIVMFTDGGPNYENTSYTADYTAPRDDSTNWSAASGNNAYDNEGTGNVSKGQPGNGQVTVGEMDETAGVAASVKDGSVGDGATRIATVFVGGAETYAMGDDAIDTYTDLPTYMENYIASSPGLARLVDNIPDLEALAEDLVAEVTVEEEVLFVGTLRQALNALSASEPGIPLHGDMPAEAGGGTGMQGCFDNSTTHYIGFEWWLPINHANEIQSDSVSFDLGFYTEQCRHNDGSGMNVSETVENGTPS